MPARVQGLIYGLGSAYQRGIGTASTTFNRFRKLDMGQPFARPGTETDKDEIGKGNEFITGVFKTAKTFAGSAEKYGSAEFTLWAWAYALGNTQLASGLYTIKPLDPATSIEMQYFTVVAQLAEGGGMAYDEAHLGVAIESVDTTFHYGPNRASLKTVCDYIGSGRTTIPSGITVPATLAENYMLASSAAISINGEDYVSAKTVLSGSMSWKNNILSSLAYTPGSGLDSDGFAVGQRLFCGSRVPAFSFTAFLQHDSTEYAKLIAQTTGTAVVTFTFDATHFVTFTWENVSFEALDRVNEEGIAAVTVNIAPRFDNGTSTVLTITGKCGISDIQQ